MSCTVHKDFPRNLQIEVQKQTSSHRPGSVNTRTLHFDIYSLTFILIWRLVVDSSARKEGLNDSENKIKKTIRFFILFLLREG